MKKFLALILGIMMTFGTLSVVNAEGPSVEEYYSQNGSYQVSSEEFASGETDFDHYKIWYPTEMLTSNKTYPVIVCSNGGGTIYSKSTQGSDLLSYIASWGYIAIASDVEPSGNGLAASKSLDFLLNKNNTEGDEFYAKINTDAIALCGHSMGGSASFNAASIGKYANAGMYKTLYAASTPYPALAAGPLQNTPYDVTQIKIPAFLTAGTGTIDAGTYTEGSEGICPLEMSLRTNAYNIDNDNVIIARKVGADHGDTCDAGKAYMMAWFDYILFGDEFAASAFVGENAEIFNNSNWQDIEYKSTITEEDLQVVIQPKKPSLIDILFGWLFK